MRRAILAAALSAAIVTGVAAASGGPSLYKPSTLHLTAPATFKAKFVTTKGSFVVTVTRSWSPKGADRFYNLVYYHYYDNQPLFRVIRGSVAQWGISGVPAIAKAWKYAYIKDDPVTHQNLRGTLTYANAGKNSRTTQVFVNLGSSNTYLDKRAGFSPIGTVTKGLYAVFHNLYSGYGQTPEADQAQMIAGGAAWVKKKFPKLDWIKTARIAG